MVCVCVCAGVGIVLCMYGCDKDVHSMEVYGL